MGRGWCTLVAELLTEHQLSTSFPIHDWMILLTVFTGPPYFVKSTSTATIIKSECSGDEWKAAFKQKMVSMDGWSHPSDYLAYPWDCLMHPPHSWGPWHRFHNLLGISVVVYFADVLVYSKSSEGHLKHVVEVLMLWINTNSLYSWRNVPSRSHLVNLFWELLSLAKASLSILQRYKPSLIDPSQQPLRSCAVLLD